MRKVVVNGEAKICFIQLDFPIPVISNSRSCNFKFMYGLWVVYNHPEIYSFNNLLSIYYVMDTVADVSTYVI